MAVLSKMERASSYADFLFFAVAPRLVHEEQEVDEEETGGNSSSSTASVANEIFQTGVV